MVLVNGLKFNDEQFHNGEVIFKETSIVNKDINKIEMKFKDNRDITALLFARQWLKDVVPKAKCVLVMEYCPYERMDRKINDQLFSMRYFAQILGKFEFCEVYILDPHSMVCWDELEYAGLKVAVCNLDYYLDKVKDEFRPDYICYPDKGAYEKYPRYIRHNDIPYFYGDKKRDLANKGKIIGYELVKSFIKGKTVPEALSVFSAAGFSFIGMVIWEIFEFFADYYIADSNNQAYNLSPERDRFFIKIFGSGVQNENQWAVFDTNVDMICATVGALVAVIVLSVIIRRKSTVTSKTAEESSEGKITC